jgi:DNA-binding CsgD family transcriptional regulator
VGNQNRSTMMINETNQLSEREREILRLVASGLSNQQIANQLGISVNTVKVHLRNVFSKIGVASRTEATMYAVRAGIVTVDRAEPALLSTAPDEPVAVEPAPAETAATLEPELALESAPPLAQTSQPTLEPAAADHLSSAAELSQELVITQPLVRQRVGWAMMALTGAALLALMLIGAWAVGWLGNAAPTENSADQARWKALPAAQIARAGFAIASSGDKLYAIGGEGADGVLDRVERYDASLGIWTELSRKPTAVADVRAAVLGGKLYVPGGRRSSDSKDITTAFERYDPNAEAWETLDALPQPRSGYALAALEGKIYLIGGWDGTAYRSEVFEYDPERGSWRERTPMPTPRAFADAGVVEGNMYVLGGENQSGQLASNEVYTPAQEGAQPWSRRAPLPQPRSRFGVAVALSVIHVLGGEPDAATPLKYNVRTDSWQPFAAPTAAIGSQPGVVQQDVSIVALGGKTGANGYSPVMQAYQALSTIFLPRQ